MNQGRRLTDKEWWADTRRRRNLDYFLVLTIQHDLTRAAGGVGFFGGDEIIAEAIRRFRRPRKHLKGPDNGS